MSLPILFAYFSFCQLWLILPPAVAFAVVYAATRHEDMTPIFHHAGRIAFWTFFFLGIIFAALYLFS